MAKASRPCPQPGCPHLAPCPTHTPPPWKGSTRGPNSAAWERVRKAALTRDAHRCVLCGTPSNIVDHITNKASGGRDTLDNAQTLCKPCHDTKTASEAAKARRA